jgi:hypothetical protein
LIQQGINISNHLSFVWNKGTGIAGVYGKDARGQEVERIFDLNGIRGRSELIKHRSRYVRRLAVIAIYAMNGDQEGLTLLREACQPDSEYSAFANSLCEAFGLRQGSN